MKKEKYISEKKRKTTTSWVVKIPYYIGSERRTYERAFSEADFGDHARAMAIYHRNEKLAEFQAGNVPQTAPTVRECFDRGVRCSPGGRRLSDSMIIFCGWASETWLTCRSIRSRRPTSR